jgi:sensor domain CHASE-containing protein
MKLRTKTLILTGIAMTVLFLIVGFISSTILMSGFNRIEDRETKEHIYMIRNVLDAERASLLVSATSIADRADTYAYFSDTSNSSYIDANFSDVHSQHEFFDVIILADTTGQIIYKKFYDRARNRAIDFPSAYLTVLQDELKHNEAGVQKSGFFILNGKPGIVAVYPVAKTDDSSNPVGCVMTMRLLDKARLKRVAMIENVPLSIKAYNEPSLAEGFKNARSSFDHGNNYYTEPIDRNIIGVYSYLRDADGDPILLLEIDIERDIAAQGRTVIS